MAKVDSNYVKKESMYIAIGVALFVGVLLGFILSSTSSNTMAPSKQSAGQAQVQSGITTQQASQIMALEQAVKANPQDVNSWTQLGHVYFDSNRPGQAIRAYTKSLELRPGDPNVLTDLGVMYRKVGKHMEAIASFDKAIAANPRHEQSRFNKGIVFMYDLGDTQSAINSWTELLKTNPAAKASNGTPIAQFIEEAKAQMPVGAPQ